MLRLRKLPTLVFDENDPMMPTLRMIARLTAALLILGTQGTLSQDLFSAPIHYTDDRQVVGSGDLDGDGDLDLVYLRSMNATEARVELNNGLGGFSPGAVLPIPGLLANSPAVLMEVTGDNLLDLVVGIQDVMSGNFELGVYAGDGIGSFSTLQSFPLTNQVYFIAVGDGDGDGRDDLLLRMAGTMSNVSTLFQWAFSNVLGGLSFGPQSVAPPTLPFGFPLETADLNADGRADVVTRNDFVIPFVIEAWFTQAGGSLAPGPTMALPSPLASISGDASIGDIDSDGDPDVLISSSGGGILNLLPWLNDGAGGFVTGPLQTPFTGYSSGQDIALLDLDQDGDLDFVHRAGALSVFSASSGGYSFFENDGAAGFTFQHAWPHGLLNGFSLAPTDLNGDGREDYIGPSDVFLNRGSLSPFGQSLPPMTRGRLFDQDGDGDLDFNIYNSLSAYVNDGTGTLSDTISERVSLPAGVPGFSYVDLLSIDWDGDGDEDLMAALYANTSGGGVFIQHEMFRNDGGATFASTGPLLINSSLNLGPLVPFQASAQPVLTPDKQMRDMNGDGTLDFVFFDSVFLQAANGRFAAPPTPSFGPWRAIETFDVEGDGDFDVLAVPSVGTNSQLAVLRNDGGGNFTPTPLVGVNLGTGLATVGDIDSDGDQDIVGFSTLPPYTMGVFINNAGSFGAPILIPLGRLTTARHLQVEDVNGDGRLDIVMSQIGSPISLQWSTSVWFQSTTPLVFNPPTYFNSGGINQVVDMDGDGDLDFAGPSNVLNLSTTPPTGGSRRQFATGVPGGDGNIPLIGATGPFRVGETGVLKLSGVPGGVGAVIAFGNQESNQPLPPYTGVFAYGAPWSLLLPLTMPGTGNISGAGNLDIPAVFPPAAANTRTYLQAAYADPQAPMGISVTGGLELIIGP